MLALENRKEPAALQYIFKLLDIEDQGYLNVFSLNYFFRVPDAHTHAHTHPLVCDMLTLAMFVLLCFSGHSGADKTPWTGTSFLPGCQGIHTHKHTLCPFDALTVISILKQRCCLFILLLVVLRTCLILRMRFLTW